MKIILCDLETCGLSSLAAVTSLSAIAVDVNRPRTLKQLVDKCIKREQETNKDIKKGFINIKFNLTDQFFDGRSFNPETQMWILKQTPEVILSMRDGTSTLKEGLEIFSDLVNLTKNQNQNKHVLVYFRGYDFDGGILDNACQMYGIPIPYCYNDKRCIRTYIDANMDSDIGYIEDMKIPTGLTRHISLDDVLIDALMMSESKIKNNE